MNSSIGRKSAPVCAATSAGGSHTSLRAPGGAGCQLDATAPDRALRVLNLEDVATDTELAEARLRDAGFRCESLRVYSRQAFAAALDGFHPDVILADYSLPGFDGAEALEMAREKRPDVPVIIVTGALGDETAIALLKAGARDYVLKDNLVRLASAVERALTDAETLRRRLRAEEELTARRRAERAIRESEVRYRASFEGASVGQALIDLDGRLIETNRALATMLGAGPGELVGKMLADVVLAQDLPRLNAAAARTVAELAVAQRCEVRLVRAGRGPLWTDVSVGALRDDVVSTSRLIMHIIDISARKAAEDDLRAETARRQDMELELRHAQKLDAVGRLAAGIAHEINTPTQFVGDSVQFLKESFAGVLRLLSTYRALVQTANERGVTAELLADVRRLEEEVDLDYVVANVPSSIERSLEGVGRIAAIVGAMKEFAHPDEREKRPADLNAALGTTLTIARNQYKYVAEVETSLGEVPLVSCHIGDLNQVFLNLIVNAAHAIEDVVKSTGTKGLIRVASARDGDFVRIDISDTGGGIPDEIRDRIFEPFFTTKPVGRGSGQGLAIARSIVVDKHGGSLTFASQVGKGTTFTIRVPIGGVVE